MSSPRITKSMRDSILTDALDHTFSKRIKDQIARGEKLGNRVYSLVYPKSVQAAMKKLGAEFIDQSHYMNVNIGGQVHRVTFNGNFEYSGNPSFSSMCHSVLVKYLKPLRRNLIAGNQKSLPVISCEALMSDIFDHDHSRHDLLTAMVTAGVQLNALLESCTTFKKLRSVWPEGEKFYNIYDVDRTEKSGVPAVVVQELNKALGL